MNSLDNLIQRVAGLSAAKQAALQQELKKGATTAARHGIPALKNRRDAALSFAQQRLWFLDRLEPGGTAYIIPGAMRMLGPLDAAAMERSLSEILRRHEILRTTFEMVDGQPVQVIVPARPFALPSIDLGQLPETEREAEVRRLATEEAQRPFDLAQGPLFRARLLQLGKDDHVLLYVMHHIVSDGWSMGVFYRELGKLYEAFSNGEPSSLPELTVQYADFAVWQRQWLEGEIFKKQLSYWKDRLQGVPLLQLPADRPRPEVRTYRGTHHSLNLGKSLTDEIKGLCRRESTTLYMTLLTAFKAFLCRYTGQEDVVVGSPIAGRNRPELGALIGFFVNTLVMRTDVSGNPTFRELLARVRRGCLEAYAHQDLPFEQLVKELDPERDLSRNPLVQVLFVLQNFPLQRLDVSGLDLSPFEIGVNTSKFDLTVFVEESQRQLVTTWRYNTDLFDAGTVARMMTHFATLLDSIVAEPDARIEALAMLPEAERRRKMLKEKERRESKLAGLRTARRSAVDLSRMSLIRTGYLPSREKFPLLVEPDVDDVNLTEWAKANREFIETELYKHGAILFRGFNLNSVPQFENFALAISPKLFGEYEDLPREPGGDKVYQSTPYPPEQPILFHNESSHMHRWPLKQWFFCLQAALQGGETPILDGRKVLQLIPAEIFKRFEAKGIMYVRNFTDNFDVRWQDFFRTRERSAVEEFCRKSAIDFEWKENNALRVRHVGPAVATHPKTGERAWFNQIQHWHPACLPAEARASLASVFSERDLPRSCYYGDGSVIEDSLVEEICRICRDAAVSFAWQERDILMIDNMMTAHARNPYIGPRKIVVALGEMIRQEAIQDVDRPKSF